MGCGVGKSEGVGLFRRLFSSTEDKSDTNKVENMEVVKEIIDNSQGDPKATPSLLGRVTKGAVVVAKSLTSTQILVMITLLSITALIIVLTFPVIKPFLIGVPVFVALAGFATTKGIAIFLITKTLALLGLSLSGAGFGLKGLMKLFSHFSSKGESKAHKPPSYARESSTEESVKSKKSDKVVDSVDVDLEKAWTDTRKTATQKKTPGGVTPREVSAQDLCVEDWSEEYLSGEESEELFEVDPKLEKAWKEARFSREEKQSPAMDRLLLIASHLQASL